MIEAVNSAVANASLLRTNGDQSQQARLSSFASSSNTEDGVKLQLAPYVSPFIEMDVTFNKAVLQIRDSSTGAVQRQFPSETTMRARAAQAEIETQSVRQLIQSSSSEENSPRVERPDGNAQANTQAPSVSAQESNSGLQSSTPATPNAQSQIASAAFSAGALSGSSVQSGGVSVLA